MFSLLIGCSPRYTKQFVADDTEETQDFLLQEYGWKMYIPSLSAFKEIKDISTISDTNNYWLTIHSFYPLENPTETKRDFKIDSVKFIYHSIDSAKYSKLIESKDKKILNEIFDLAYLKKKNFNRTVGEYFEEFPYIKNKVLTKIDSIQVPADTVWSKPSRKAPFMDTDKDNFHVAYNFFDTSFVKIFDDVLKVELVFSYEIIDDQGNPINANTVSCLMYRDDSAKDLLFFLE